MPFPGHSVQALAVYAEPLVARRHVVVFGRAGTGLEARLEDLGARTVVRVAPEEDLASLRGARFDLALVPDLGLYDDPEALLARVRLTVGEAGVALVAASNRDTAGPETVGAFDYYDLFDLVAHEFADVRMIARLPFHGVALAEMSGEDSPVVSVDTQLLDGAHSPEAFVALASQRGVSLDPYAIIELPTPEESPVSVDLSAEREASEELVEARQRNEELSSQVEALAARAALVVELEVELAVSRGQLAQLATAVETSREAAESGRTAVALAEVRVHELIDRAARAEQVLSRIQPELANIAESHALELARLEEALLERARIIHQQQAELSRRERLIRDLVQSVDEHVGNGLHHVEPTPVTPRDDSMEAALAQDNARLRGRLDALALDLARREGEAQAAAWTITELERRVDRGGHGSSGDPVDQRLAGALDELDALRKALVQEHEARARAESAAAPPPSGSDSAPPG